MGLGLFNQQQITASKIDPRTKIIVLAVLSFIVFSDAPFYIVGTLVLIPFFCLFFFSKYKKIAIFYISLLIIAKYIQNYILPTSTGVLSMLIVAFIYITTRFIPVLTMGLYTILTTKVSEFIAAMEKNNVPKYIIIPISVIFRYIPTIYDEIKSIRNAMKMRGLGLNFKSLKDPLKLLEFYMVPILISAVKTSDELSAASLTRGISNPKKRTHLYFVKINVIDIALIITSISGLIIYLSYVFGGI